MTLPKHPLTMIFASVAFLVALPTKGGAAEPPVYPGEASGLRPVELSDLLLDALLPSDSSALTWDHMSAAPIVWVTDGVEEEHGWSVRNGLARVRVGGVYSTVLKRQRNELAWTVSLKFEGPARFGPEVIWLAPGAPEEGCFGALFTDCDIDVRALKTTDRLRVEICKADSSMGLGNEATTFLLSAYGKRSATLVHSNSCGSGGCNSWLELFPTKSSC